MNQLLTKVKNAPIGYFANLPKIRKVTINVPKKANSFDYVKVLKGNKSTVDIITFYSKSKENKPAKILKRYFVTTGRLGKEIIERKYIRLKDVLSQEPMRIRGRKIITKRSFEGENLAKTVTLQTITDRKDDTPVLHISKVKTYDMGHEGVRKEEQSLFEYQNGMKPKGYKISSYFRTAHAFLNDIFEPVFRFVNISNEKQNLMKNDPFLPLHLYSMRDFKKVAPSVAVNPEHRPALPFSVKWFNYNDDISGYCQDDIKLNHFNIKTRSEVVCTSAHENEHSYQKEQALFYAFKKGIKNPKVELSDEKIEHYRNFWNSDYPKKIDSVEKAKLYYDEMSNYINPSKNLDEYKKQLVEQEAISASTKVLKEYLKSLSSLKEEFPYAPHYMIGSRPVVDELLN